VTTEPGILKRAGSISQQHAGRGDRALDLALSASTSETTFFTVEIDPALLVVGTNALTAEVHQSSATSSDMSFDLALSGTPQPKLQFQLMRGGRVWLFWSDERLGLEEASKIEGPWHALNGSSSPALMTPDGIRFYRLR